MSADPAYQAWRGQKLMETTPANNAAQFAAYILGRVDMIAEDTIDPPRRVAQPHWEALGFGNAYEAEGRN